MIASSSVCLSPAIGSLKNGKISLVELERQGFDLSLRWFVADDQSGAAPNQKIANFQQHGALGG